jgi:predicted DCC family thiol-disulfide oxidoreductase YuxK
LYDADCGFCTRVARRLPSLRIKVDLAPIQTTDLAAYEVDASLALREMPFVTAGGEVRYGHRAWAAVLRTGPWPARALGRALGSRLLDGPARAVYRWVSENRQRMPGGTPACSLDGRA